MVGWNSELKIQLATELKIQPAGDSSNSGSNELPWTPNDDRDAYNSFLQRKSGSPSTERRYARELFRFYLWLYHANKQGIKSVTPTDIESYLSFCIAPPVSWCGNSGGNTKIYDPEWRPFKKRPSINSNSRFGTKPSVNTIQNASSILKSFFSFLVKQGYLRGDPTASISGEFRPSVMASKAAKADLRSVNSSDNYPCRPAEIPEGLSETQWKCLLETIEAMPRKSSAQKMKYYRAEFVIKLLYYAGLRSEEARSHSHKAFKFDQRFNCWKLVIYGKGAKKREIPVHHELLSALKKYRAFHGLTELPRTPNSNIHIDYDVLPLFPPYKPFIRNSAGEIVEALPPITERSADEWIKTLFKQAENRMKGQYSTEVTKTALSFCSSTLHTIRHTRARHMLFLEKHDIRVVQAFLGHTKILTTQIYTEPTLHDLFECANIRQS